MDLRFIFCSRNQSFREKRRVELLQIGLRIGKNEEKWLYDAVDRWCNQQWMRETQERIVSRKLLCAMIHAVSIYLIQSETLQDQCDPPADPIPISYG